MDFSGLHTALITPFKNGAIDEETTFKLIDKQLEAGIDGLVLLGTTGESPTITQLEQDHFIKSMITYINKRCLVMVGTGTNCTQSTIERSIIAQKAGADAVLLVNPYYNKPTQKGMLEHFTAVADSVEIPIMLYNIQGRSGVNLEVPTVLKLSEHPRIVGVKEASGKVGQVEALAKVLPPDFVILSGDDGLTYAISKAGGVGCISVLSNALPDAMKSLVEACNNQRWTEAKALDDTLQPLFTAGGLEVNPQPIKTILAYENLCEETFRLPLTTMESGNREQLIAAWEAYKSKN